MMTVFSEVYRTLGVGFISFRFLDGVHNIKSHLFPGRVHGISLVCLQCIVFAGVPSIMARVSSLALHLASHMNHEIGYPKLI